MAATGWEKLVRKENADVYFLCKHGKLVSSNRMVLSLKSAFFRGVSAEFLQIPNAGPIMYVMAAHCDAEIVQLVMDKVHRGRVIVPVEKKRAYEELMALWEVDEGPLVPFRVEGHAQGQPQGHFHGHVQGQTQGQVHGQAQGKGHVQGHAQGHDQGQAVMVNGKSHPTVANKVPRPVHLEVARRVAPLMRRSAPADSIALHPMARSPRLTAAKQAAKVRKDALKRLANPPARATVAKMRASIVTPSAPLLGWGPRNKVSLPKDKGTGRKKGRPRKHPEKVLAQKTGRKVGRPRKHPIQEPATTTQVQVAAPPVVVAQEQPPRVRNFKFPLHPPALSDNLEHVEGLIWFGQHVNDPARCSFACQACGFVTPHHLSTDQQLSRIRYHCQGHEGQTQAETDNSGAVVQADQVSAKGDNPLKCPICSKSFNREAARKNHVEKFHSGSLADLKKGKK